MPFPKNRPPTTGSYGPAGFGVQYQPKKKKYTGPAIPQSVTKRYGIDNFKPTIKDKLKSAVTKPASSPVRSMATSPRPTRQTFKRPDINIPSRSGDDVVGPNRPPSRSGDDTPDYSLTVKLGSIKRRLYNDDSEEAKKRKKYKRPYGGM